MTRPCVASEPDMAAESFPGIGGVKQRLPGQQRGVRACGLLGHRPRYRSEGATLVWECVPGCGMSGQKSYATPARARRYADALNREDRDNLGRRPLLSLLPLKLMGRDDAIGDGTMLCTPDEASTAAFGRPRSVRFPRAMSAMSSAAQNAGSHGIVIYPNGVWQR
jgi:hypothetical protein